MFKLKIALRKFLNKSFQFMAIDLYNKVNALYEYCFINLSDMKINQLKLLLKNIEHYQPIYNLNLIESPARTCKDRCEKIYDYFNNDVGGMRFLDIGSSLGYISFYLADRGAKVEGWEANIENAQASRLVSEITGIQVDFKIHELNLDSVTIIKENRFDAILVLSVFHHIIHFQGLENAQKIVRKLLKKCPLLIVELAKKGEDPNLYWDATQPENELDLFAGLEVEITKIGAFNNHLSDNKRPLYIIKSQQIIQINKINYLYDSKQCFAYKHSPIRIDADRCYYFNSEYIIKQYSRTTDINKANTTVSQIFNEISLLSNLPLIARELEKEEVFSSINTPQIMDMEILSTQITLVMKRKPGTLLWDLINNSQYNPKQTGQLLSIIYQRIKALHELGIHHNDIRMWNILVDTANDQHSIIDYGLAGPLPHENDIHALLWVAYYALNLKQQPAFLEKDLPIFTESQLQQIPLLTNLMESFNSVH